MLSRHPLLPAHLASRPSAAAALRLGRVVRRVTVLLAACVVAASAITPTVLVAQPVRDSIARTVAIDAAGTASGLAPAATGAIDRLFAPFAGDTTPGYAVAVLRDGHPVYARGFGMANLDELAPITPSTAFNIASLSKQFTAACLALVILDGKVRLDDTAAAYVPALAKYHRAGARPSSSSTSST
jgi:CubicO group peptidase (beta-lactamase class C family)